MSETMKTFRKNPIYPLSKKKYIKDINYGLHLKSKLNYFKKSK